MKKIIVVFLGLSWILAQTSFAENARSQNVLSFKDWKNAKISEAQSAILQLETMEKTTPARFGPEEKSKLEQAKTNLDITKDLNAQDYFVLYLSPRFQNDQTAYVKAVQMMTAEETAQILLAYDRMIEERRKKNLLPIDNAKFGFGTPKKLEPAQVLSSIGE